MMSQPGQQTFDYVMSLQTGFCTLLNAYFNDMQIKRWSHLPSSIWRIPFCCNLFRGKIDMSNSINSYKQLNCISSLMACKLFFPPNSLIIQKGRREERDRENWQILLFGRTQKVLSVFNLDSSFHNQAEYLLNIA